MPFTQGGETDHSDEVGSVLESVDAGCSSSR